MGSTVNSYMTWNFEIKATLTVGTNVIRKLTVF